MEARFSFAFPKGLFLKMYENKHATVTEAEVRQAGSSSDESLNWERPSESITFGATIIHYPSGHESCRDAAGSLFCG